MFVGDRLRHNPDEEYMEICDISCDSDSIPSVILVTSPVGSYTDSSRHTVAKFEDNDKYIHLPSKKMNAERNFSVGPNKENLE